MSPWMCDNPQNWTSRERAATSILWGRGPQGGGGFIFGPRVAAAAAAGRLNHPCPWPLAALISGERRSRTRSISCAAANDTSPAPLGPEPRKRLRHGPSITASHCLFATERVAAVLWVGGRRTRSQKEKGKESYFPFLLVGPEKQQVDEEAERKGGGRREEEERRWKGKRRA